MMRSCARESREGGYSYGNSSYGGNSYNNTYNGPQDAEMQACVQLYQQQETTGKAAKSS